METENYELPNGQIVKAPAGVEVSEIVSRMREAGRYKDAPTFAEKAVATGIGVAKYIGRDAVNKLNVASNVGKGITGGLVDPLALVEKGIEGVSGQGINLHNDQESIANRAANFGGLAFGGGKVANTIANQFAKRAIPRIAPLTAPIEGTIANTVAKYLPGSVGGLGSGLAYGATQSPEQAMLEGTIGLALGPALGGAWNLTKLGKRTFLPSVKSTLDLVRRRAEVPLQKFAASADDMPLQTGGVTMQGGAGELAIQSPSAGTRALETVSNKAQDLSQAVKSNLSKYVGQDGGRLAAVNEMKNQLRAKSKAMYKSLAGREAPIDPAMFDKAEAAIPLDAAPSEWGRLLQKGIEKEFLKTLAVTPSGKSMIKKALNVVKEAKQDARIVAQDLEVLQQARSVLSNQLKTAKPQKVGMLGAILKNIDDTIDGTVSGYKQAVDDYALSARTGRAIEAGENVVGMSPQQYRRELPEPNTLERRGFVAGADQGYKDALENVGSQKLPSKFYTPRFKNRLEDLVGSDRSERIANSVQAKKAFDSVYNVMNNAVTHGELKAGTTSIRPILPWTTNDLLYKTVNLMRGLNPGQSKEAIGLLTGSNKEFFNYLKGFEAYGPLNPNIPGGLLGIVSQLGE